jgi:hypothetical protein
MKLRSLLWSDFLLGFITGMNGILFSGFLETFLQISETIIIVISIVTLLYSLFAFYLAQLKNVSINLTKFIINANWFWSFVSVGFLFLYFSNASIFGKLFLILQIIVVGGLAYLEGKALKEGNH